MPRGGTTSLYHIFEQHPGCFVPFRKETAYFSYNFYKGEKWYRGLYDDCPGGRPALDVSPQYFADLRSIDRLKTLAPNAKVVLSVRDPVEWAISSFLQTNKFERKPCFSDFLEGYTITTAREIVHYKLADGYVREAINAFRESFGANLLLYRFDLFRDQPLRVLKAIEQFGGMLPHFTEASYSTTRVNGSDQYNWRWLTWVLSREPVITAIDTVFPRPFIRRARLAVDRFTMPKQPPARMRVSDDERRLAERRLADDRGWVEAFFAEGPIKLGDGTLFELAACTADEL